jgi:hypothetical protein
MLDVDAEPRVGEVALPAHLRDGDIRIPVGDRTFACVRFVLDLGQAVRGGRTSGVFFPSWL